MQNKIDNFKRITKAAAAELMDLLDAKEF